MKKFFSFFITFLCLSQIMFAQGRISGDLMLNVNFFQRDSNIKAVNNPLYDNFLSGGEGWLSLRYADSKGFSANVRFDAFNNSNLLNPTSAYSGAGLGMFNITKEFNKLTISGGHIYDQIGSGALFRAYEDRGLLIDNALFGFKLQYQLAPNWKIKGYTGQVKYLFERYKPIIKAANIEGDYALGKKAFMTSGIGLLNRTMDQESMNSVVSTINALPAAERFVPKYNNYGVTLYNTLNVGALTWYVEGAYKSEEAIVHPINGNVLNSAGNILFSTLGIAKEKIGVNMTFKRTEKFVQRTSPNEVLLRGMYNWQPIVAPIRTQRVISRYSPQSQDISELAGGINVFYTPKDDLNFNISYTYIDDLEKVKLYREFFGEMEYRGIDKWIFHLGTQVMHYSQEMYQVKFGYPMVKGITPFAEAIYKIDKKNSVRCEMQYLSTHQDYGSWGFLLFEYNLSPGWSFALSDMYNTKPEGKNGEGREPTHYPNVFIAYTKDAHRFTAQYVKQVEGINCTGGVCRYEPAFSGFKIGVTSSF